MYALIVDPSGLIVGVNPSTGAIGGIPAANLARQPLAMLDPPDGQSRVSALVASGQSEGEFRVGTTGELMKVKAMGEVTAGRHLLVLSEADGAAVPSTLIQTGVCVVELDGRIRSANSTACRILGLQRDELDGLTVYNGNWSIRRADGTPVEPDDYPVLVAIRTGRRTPKEVYAVFAEDPERMLWVQVSAEPRRATPDGPVTQAVLTFEDITEVKRQEEEIRHIHRQQAALLNATSDVVMLVDHQGVLLECNEAACRHFGKSRDEMLGTNLVSYSPEPLRESRHAQLLQVLETGVNRSFEDARDDRFFLHNLSAVKGEDGQVEGVAIYLRETTEQRRMERDWQELFRLMMDGFAAHRIICDESGKPVDYEFLAVNPAFEQLTGLTAEEVVGKRVREVIPEVEESWIETYGKVALTGESTRFSSYSSDLDKWFEVAAFQTQPGCFACIFSDVTSRRNAEEVLRESERKLGHQNAQLEAAVADLKGAQQLLLRQERLRVLESMASGIAHDFNNSLAVIRGFCDLLINTPKRRQDEARLLKTLTNISEAADAAGETVAKMRLLYRQDDDAAPGQEATDLPKLMREVVELTRPRWQDQALSQGVTINVIEELADLPPLVINGAELRQAVTNLVLNAADAVEQQGTIVVRLAEERQSVVIEVADTGCGMDEATRARCLDPFFTTKGPDGTGLGLSIVHSVALHNEGTITIESQPGEGTRVALRLPLQVRQEADAEGGDETLSVRNLKVLVVEDEEMIREIISEFLESAGHIAIAVADGKTALEHLRDDLFDVLITDRAMPDMHGDQLALAAKELDEQLPVIMVTGFGLDMQARDEMPPGIDRLLPKPINVDDLLRTVREVCSG